MTDINFLGNKQPGEDEKPKDGKKEKPAWSNPEKSAESAKSSAFSFLPFIKKSLAGEKPVAATDKNKIKKSRKEILNLIKRQEKPKPSPKVKAKNFLASLAEKLKKPSAPKEVLADYQRVFNREKEHKEQIGKVFNIKPPPVQPAINNEEKPVEVKEPEPIKREAKRRVLETNLMQGELSAFFDWRPKVIILIVSILAPLAVVITVYYGLALYQKSSQAKNSARTQKFAELAQAISQEETGLKEILAFQSKLKAVSLIFTQHIYWTNFFKFLEDNTIKDVYFVNFKGDTSGNYALDAVTAAYGRIAEQVKVFKDNKKITAVSANGGELAAEDDKNKSLVKFILDFSVLKSIFIE